jgi:hypothetical protein
MRRSRGGHPPAGFYPTPLPLVRQLAQLLVPAAPTTREGGCEWSALARYALRTGHFLNAPCAGTRPAGGGATTRAHLSNPLVPPL